MVRVLKTLKAASQADLRTVLAGREKKFYKNAKFLLTESLSSHTTLFALSDWAIVQLAGRRILAPIIKVRVLVAQPSLAEKIEYVPIV